MDARRSIPSVERLLSSEELKPLLQRESRAHLTELVRSIQNDLRGEGIPARGADWYAAQLEQRLAESGKRSLRDVINATGVVLHTNLGRAPLSDSAIAAMSDIARGYNNLEYDIDEGARGSRYTHCESLLRTLTNAEAALVVNNNAAALVLVLNTIAMGKPVVVSRGELVEIGDSFRIAEIAERSGITLREVGATNRTHLKDYAAAIEGAAAILKVHPSNFKTSGFVSETKVGDLSPLGRMAGIPIVHDLGSGLIESLADLGLDQEPTASQALAAGADIVTMSGDKLLGGPQAGIIIGNAALIASMKRNPLCRALRVDKLTLAALEATLQSYSRGTARADIPILRMIAASSNDLKKRATELSAGIENTTVIEGYSTIGGGAFPDAALPAWLVAVSGPADVIEAKLRAGSPPVIARIANGSVLIDLRTVLPHQESALAKQIADAI